MTDCTKYLLRTGRQISAFRAMYSGYISAQSDAYVSWIYSWPPLVWVDFLAGIPDRNVPVVIGTICILYVDRRIDIDFNDAATRLRRWWTPDEEREFWKQKRKRRKQRM